MQRIHAWLLVALSIVTSVHLSACAPRSVEAGAVQATSEEPARIEHIDGSELSRVFLSEEAARRIDLQTDSVRELEASGTPRTVVPYSAVLYDLNGETWVYTSPEPLSFVRHSISVDSIDGDLAILSDGPPPGTQVVTVGVAELFGAEFEFQEQ
jgi:hypothetical protein